MTKKNVSLLVSAAGWIAGLVEKLVNALRERGVTDQEIHALVLENGNAPVSKIADAIAEFVKQAKEVVKSLYPISVDYTRRVEELVWLGKYDWFNGNIIAKNFPTKRTGKAEMDVELFHFDRNISQNISSEDAIKEMDEAGYRPAELHELLAFGAKYQNTQREFPIVALGLYGNRHAAYLYRFGSKRSLNLGNFGGGWAVNCRFAAVRK